MDESREYFFYNAQWEGHILSSHKNRQGLIILVSNKHLKMKKCTPIFESMAQTYFVLITFATIHVFQEQTIFFLTIQNFTRLV